MEDSFVENLRPIDKRLAELFDHKDVCKKQIRELWVELDRLRAEFTDFATEQKMVMGFLDTQQKTKFSVLQKDVSNLMSLYGPPAVG